MPLEFPSYAQLRPHLHISLLLLKFAVCQVPGQHARPAAQHGQGARGADDQQLPVRDGGQAEGEGAGAAAGEGRGGGGQPSHHRGFRDGGDRAHAPAGDREAGHAGGHQGGGEQAHDHWPIREQYLLTNQSSPLPCRCTPRRSTTTRCWSPSSPTP